jgi:hypothetical protein
LIHLHGIVKTLFLGFSYTKTMGNTEAKPIAGPQGPQGQQGPQGPPGPQGIAGVNGTNGVSLDDVKAKSLWCADGNVCNLPSNIQQINVANADATGFSAVSVGAGSYLFKNGSQRAQDGGANTLTLRNENGDIRIMSSNPNGVVSVANQLNVNKICNISGKNCIDLGTDGGIRLLNPRGDSMVFQNDANLVVYKKDASSLWASGKLY